jgi:hypothetical protein
MTARLTSESCQDFSSRHHSRASSAGWGRGVHTFTVARRFMTTIITITITTCTITTIITSILLALALPLLQAHLKIQNHWCSGK